MNASTAFQIVVISKMTIDEIFFMIPKSKKATESINIYDNFYFRITFTILKIITSSHQFFFYYTITYLLSLSFTYYLLAIFLAIKLTAHCNRFIYDTTLILEISLNKRDCLILLFELELFNYFLISLLFKKRNV